VVKEKECLECKRPFPVSSMIRGSKTNPYGDKVSIGYLCRRCYKNRVERRSKILLFFTFFSGIIGVFFFGLIGYMYLFVKSLLADQFISTVNTFLLLGFLFILFSTFLFYLRYKELSRMRKQIRSLG
jgi:ABC-type microcin C transport system permease subunit YejE